MTFERMGSDIEYGPVVINENSYLLPVKTVLFFRCGGDALSQPV